MSEHDARRFKVLPFMNEDEEMAERRGDIRIMFDYIHKLSTLVLVGLLGWAGVSINQGNIQIALLTQRVEQVSKAIDLVSNSRYTAADASRDLALRDQILRAMEKRLERLEQVE